MSILANGKLGVWTVIFGGLALGSLSPSLQAEPPTAAQPAASSPEGIQRFVVTKDGVWVLKHDVAEGKLSYAIIEGPKPETAKSAIIHGNQSVRIYFPGTVPVQVFGSGRVLQLRDGKLEELKEPVSAEEFQAFAESQREDYSLGELRKFVEERRKK